MAPERLLAPEERFFCPGIDFGSAESDLSRSWGTGPLPVVEEDAQKAHETNGPSGIEFQW